MFTGIITHIGTIADLTQEGDFTLAIACDLPSEKLALGASIACDGICLTVVESGEGWFKVNASHHTANLTTLGTWKRGTRVNLEAALCLGDALGGHLVSGHVDGVATVLRITPKQDSHEIELEAPAPLAKYIATKGSVTLDGVSLTVNSVAENRFTVNIIPHTWTNTSINDWREGTKVNLEIDMLARYVERMMSHT